MANLNLKFKRTLEMQKKGLRFHCEHFPERAKVYDALHKRRVLDKPVDGSCFVEAGERIKEMHAKGVR